MDLKILVEVLDTINSGSYMYQWHCRRMEAEDRDMRPSECDEEANEYVRDFLLDDFGDDLTDEIWDEVLKSMTVAVAGNDNFVQSGLVEVDPAHFKMDFFK